MITKVRPKEMNNITVIESADVSRDIIIRINKTSGVIQYNPIFTTFDDSIQAFLLHQVCAQKMFDGDIIAADRYAIKFYMGRGHDIKKLIRFIGSHLPINRLSVDRLHDTINYIKNERAEQKKD